MAINDSTIYNDVWVEVKNKLVTTGLYITNSETSATTAVSIEAAYGDEIVTRNSVRIYPARLDEEFDKFSSNQGKKDINIIIDCVGKVGKYADELKGQVRNILIANDITGIDLVGLTDNGFFTPVSREKFYGQSLTFTYMRE